MQYTAENGQPTHGTPEHWTTLYECRVGRVWPLDCSHKAYEGRSSKEQKMGSTLHLHEHPCSTHQVDQLHGHIMLYKCLEKVLRPVRTCKADPLKLRNQFSWCLQRARNISYWPQWTWCEKVSEQRRLLMDFQFAPFFSYGRSLGAVDCCIQMHTRHHALPVLFRSPHPWGNLHLDDRNHSNYQHQTTHPHLYEPRFAFSTDTSQEVSTPLPPPDDFKDANLHKQQWKQVQHLANMFWRRWRCEYLTTCQSCGKW